MSSPRYYEDSPTLAPQGNNPNSNSNSNSPWNLNSNSNATPSNNRSPWSLSSNTGSGYDSLTLPPINPNNNYEDLPSFSDSQYFDPALPHIASPAYVPELSNFRSSQNSRNLPPPSNQQARSSFSQYQLTGSESPDPFDEPFRYFTPPPPEMPPRTRTSSVVDLTESSPAQTRSDGMVQGRKRKASISVAEARATKAVRPSSSSSRQLNRDDVPVVDLEEINSKEEYEELKAKERAELIKQQNQAEATKPVRLAEFQCIICMDNPTDLTVTHCGHLFCSECLHQALHAGDKKCCPVCRTAIVLPKAGAKSNRSGVFPLTMKLMTKKKLGKRPATSVS